MINPAKKHRSNILKNLTLDLIEISKQYKQQIIKIQEKKV